MAHNFPPSPPNIIVFGETGAGKSSLVNLIAGYHVAQTSSGADGCTLDVQECTIEIHGRTFHLFDTVGLNEPYTGKSGYIGAIQKSYRLIRSLEKSGGVQLLIFCVRGKITATVQSNWKLFHDVFCSQKVPILLVINGLEQEPSMDGWWKDNESHFHAAGIKPSAHVCITSTRGFDNVYAERYDSSAVTVRKEIVKLWDVSNAWKPDKKIWLARVVAFFLRPGNNRPSPRRMQTILRNKIGLTKEDAATVVDKFAEVDAEFTFGVYQWASTS